MTSVRSRILLFFTLFALVSCIAIYMGMRNTNSIAKAAQSVASEHLPIVHALDKLELAIQQQDNYLYRYISTGDKTWLDRWEYSGQDYDKWYLKAQSEVSEASEEDNLTEIDELYLQYENYSRKILLSPRRFSADTAKLREESDQYLVQIQSVVNQISSRREGMTLAHQAQIESVLKRHKTFAFLFLLVVVGLFSALALYLFYFLVRPLTLLLDGIRNFTRGKTDVVVPPIGKDELGVLQEAFNEMSRELNVERKRLRAESQSDSLTGLFNMRYFKRQLIEEFSRSHRYGRLLTILMIDVDHFKNYNDRNGHPAGDIVLKEISRILIRNVRGTDIVARYGGEEFVILLPETSMESALKVAEKIRKTVQEHHFPFKDTYSAEKLSVSIGVSSYPDVRVGSDQDLIEASDKALYLAKKKGRNRICVFYKGETISHQEYEEATSKSLTPSS